MLAKEPDDVADGDAPGEQAETVRARVAASASAGRSGSERFT
jgi:hypothetical protein